MSRIAVALSGGGHRASLFGLGVLLYLADSGENGRVTSIASVSGGSLTNGHVAQVGGFRRQSGEQFRRTSQSLARRIVRDGTLWSAWTTWCYLLAAALGLVASCATLWLPWPPVVRGVALLLSLAIWAKLLLAQRGRVCALAFRKRLFQPDARATRLRDIDHDEIDHVICATDLHAGEHVYFSGNFVCSYRFGYGAPGDMLLADAVQASAAFPVGFPVRWFSTADFRFREGRETASSLALIDGGVYDNMAEQWALGLRNRRTRWSDLAPQFQDADELIVVNASAGLRFESTWALRLPLIGELWTLTRVMNVLYENTTSPRRRLLVDTFRRADEVDSNDALRGALIGIDQSPFAVPDYFQQHGTPEQIQRAQAALEFLGPATREEWAVIVARNSRVATTLRALGEEASLNLLRHAYVSAMVNLHVILGYPLLKSPVNRESFAEWL